MGENFYQAEMDGDHLASDHPLTAVSRPKKGEQHHASAAEEAWEVVEMRSQGYPVRQICQVVECTRSTYDYQPRHCDNATPQAAIVRLTET